MRNVVKAALVVMVSAPLEYAQAFMSVSHDGHSQAKDNCPRINAGKSK